MPVKLRTPKTRRTKVTPAAVEAFRAGDHAGLYEALALRPWETNPLDVPSTGAPPAYLDRNPDQQVLHVEAEELRRELEAASRKT